MKLRLHTLASSPLFRGSSDPLIGLANKPFPYFGTESGQVILPIIGTPVTKKIIKITSGGFGSEPKTVYEGPDPRAAADAYGRDASESLFTQLTQEPKKPKGLLDALEGLMGGIDGVGHVVSSYIDPLPDGSFKFEEGRIVAGSDDSETGLVVFSLFNTQGLALLGEDGKRPKPVAGEANIDAGGRYQGHLLVFALNKGDSVFLADPDQKRVFHCTWNGDQVVTVTYTDKEFSMFAKIAPEGTNVPLLEAPADATAAS